MTKEEAKKVIMEFAGVFNETFSHYIIDSDVDKFLKTSKIVNENSVLGDVSDCEFYDHNKDIRVDGVCEKCGGSEPNQD